MSEQNCQFTKVVQLGQFSTLFHAKLMQEIDFSEACQINVQAKGLLLNMAAMSGVLNGRQQELVDTFKQCNTDGTHGFYKNAANDDLYLSGGSLQLLAQILIGNSEKADDNAEAVLSALVGAFNKAHDFQPFIAYSEDQTVSTDNGEIKAQIRPVMLG